MSSSGMIIRLQDFQDQQVHQGRCGGGGEAEERSSTTTPLRTADEANVGIVRPVVEAAADCEVRLVQVHPEVKGAAKAGAYHHHDYPSLDHHHVQARRPEDTSSFYTCSFGFGFAGDDTFVASSSSSSESSSAGGHLDEYSRNHDGLRAQELNDSIPHCHEIGPAAPVAAAAAVGSSTSDWGAQPGAGGGEGGLLYDFSRNLQVSPIDMETQELIKLERKRLRNRLAASKCRKKKLEKISVLNDQVNELAAHNESLVSTIDQLKATVRALKSIVDEHTRRGCLIVQTCNNAANNL